MSADSAAAFAAVESIMAGEWDRFLLRIQGAIRMRMRTQEYQDHIVAGDESTAEVWQS